MTDLDVLAFIRDHKLNAADDDAIRAQFGSPARFYQRLTRVLQDPAAVEMEPMLVYRLQRIRDARRDNRAARRL